MAIYIKGIEMPTDCAMLLKIFPDGRVGVPVHRNWMGTMVVNDAEAVPVPPHGDLIDRAELVDSFDSSDFWNPSAEDNCFAAIHVVNSMPTIIPAEEEGHA